MKKLITLSLLIAFTTIIFSCADNTANQTRGNGNALVEVSASWDELGDVPPERFPENTSKAKWDSTVTDFGIRIEYLSENAVFSQSVENSDGQSTALVTLDIPTADSVAIYAVAVTKDYVINMGVIKSTVLDNATTYQFTANDFNWFAPSWGAGADFDTENAEVARASKSESRADIEFNVVNPFDGEEKSDYSEFIIKINGSGGINNYQGDNVWEYFASVENPSVGEVDTVVVEWFPRLDGNMFNLNNSRQIIDERATFEVIFE